MGLIGGFLDATGGGGWGPIVTSSLLVKGVKPAVAIGTANLAEFMVAICAAGVFVAFASSIWPAIVGLTLGGVVAAPDGRLSDQARSREAGPWCCRSANLCAQRPEYCDCDRQLQTPPDAPAKTEAVVLNHSDSGNR